MLPSIAGSDLLRDNLSAGRMLRAQHSARWPSLTHKDYLRGVLEPAPAKCLAVLAGQGIGGDKDCVELTHVHQVDLSAQQT